MIDAIRQFHDWMRTCVRNDDGRCLEGLEVVQGLSQGCVFSSLLLNGFFAAILLVALERFSQDAGVPVKFIHIQELPSKVGPEAVLEYGRRAICGMVYADNACIMSRSPRRLGRKMAVFVEVFGTFGQTVSESKTETVCILIVHGTGNADGLRCHGATVPLDNLLNLFERHRD